MKDANHVPVFLMLGRIVRDHGQPLMPFEIRPGGVVGWPDSGIPFFLHPDHADLPHWTAANDAGPPRPGRPTHGGYPSDER